MKHIALAALLLSAMPALSETKMTATEFETFTKGSTLLFNRHGAPYGAEQYLDNNGVIWSFLDGTCQRGRWFAERDEICFIYEGQNAPLCWYFLEDGGRQSARVVGDTPENDLIVSDKSTNALACPGPEVGV